MEADGAKHTLPCGQISFIGAQMKDFPHLQRNLTKLYFVACPVHGTKLINVVGNQQMLQKRPDLQFLWRIPTSAFLQRGIVDVCASDSRLAVANPR